MGVTLSYQSIPPTSNFYRRVQHDKQLYILLVYLFPLGCGIFDIFNFDPLFPDNIDDDIEETIEDILENQDIFISRQEVILAIAEYRQELMLTRRAFPGIEVRTASLEKTWEEVKERLSQELESRKIQDYEVIIDDLLYGDGVFAIDLSTEEHSLSLVSRDAVSRGAAILSQIDPEALFLREERYYFESFARWRNFYIEVDEMQEEILMDVL